MTVDISGLFLTEVEISVQGEGIMVITQIQECIDDTLSLPSPIWTYESQKGIVHVSPRGTETIALAERLAATWEGKGYKVRRKVTPLHSFDSREVQSFILA